MLHTGVRTLPYNKYLKWGSVASPAYTIALLVWQLAFWGTIFLPAGRMGTGMYIIQCSIGMVCFSKGL